MNLSLRGLLLWHFLKKCLIYHNLVILSLLKKAKNLLGEIFLLRLTPRNPLGRYAQYNKKFRLLPEFFDLPRKNGSYHL